MFGSIPRCVSPARALFLCLLLGTLVRESSANPRHETAGRTPPYTVVIDAQHSAGAGLPSPDGLAADPASILDALRSRGLRVATDPSLTCIGVSGATHIPDEDALDVLDGRLSEAAACASILERLTKQQVSTGLPGFLDVDRLSKSQLAAVLQLAPRYRFLQEWLEAQDGEAKLRVGVSPCWALHLLTHDRGQVLSRQVTLFPHPPSSIQAPPLAGSLLWYAWSAAAGAWGQEIVNVEAGTYTVGTLAGLLRGSQKAHLQVEVEVAGRQLAVAAKNVPLKSLLWAVEAATGLRVSLQHQLGQPPSVTISSPSTHGGGYSATRNLLLPIKDLGYFSAGDFAVCRQLMAGLRGGPSDRTESWVGWRLSDLPAMYADAARAEWQRQCASASQLAPPLAPDRSYLIWVKAIEVAVELQSPEGQGAGFAVRIPWL